jgi:hypothetical protein
MNDRERTRYDAFLRVKTFGTTYATDFAPGSVAATDFAGINTVIAALDTAKAGQKPGKNTSKEVLLDSLRLDLRNITRTAAIIAQNQPGFADNFHPLANNNEGVLITTADKFLAEFAAQPALVGRFTAYELPATFVTALQADRTAIASTQSQVEAGREAGVSATSIVGELIAQGMKALNSLNAIMYNKYGSQPAKMAAWLTAAHIERTAHQTVPISSPVNPTPTPTPAPAPTPTPVKPAPTQS